MRWTENETELMQTVFGWKLSSEIRHPPAKYGRVVREGGHDWAFAQELVKIGLAVMFRRKGDVHWNLRASSIENDGKEGKFWKDYRDNIMKEYQVIIKGVGTVQALSDKGAAAVKAEHQKMYPDNKIEVFELVRPLTSPRTKRK